MALYRDRQSNDDDRRGRPQADGLDNRWSIDEPAGRDQRDQRNRTGGGPQGPDDYERMNRAILRGTALIMALCLAFALPQPDALIAPMFSGYLFAAAGAAMLWGLFTRKAPTAPHLTHWDQAALLLAASLFAGFFTDPEAARQAAEQMQQTSGALNGAGGETSGSSGASGAGGG
ncbi:MAG: hypothetical protein RIB45_10950 [Marivibrio sp.]|uniref:hypothetical protein n=1 Tax=Marivibrio sp. TaxID=2039719 RepID=UPI0032EF176E